MNGVDVDPLTTWWQTCYRIRVTPTYVEYLSAGLLITSIFAILVTCCGLSIMRAVYSKQSATTMLILGQTCSAAAFLLFSRGMLVSIRDKMGDMRCNTHPNGISGHVATYTFILAVLALQAIPELSHCTTQKTRMLIASSAMTCSLLPTTTLVMIIFCETYLGGFHTPQQMVYGLVFGLASFFVYFSTIHNLMTQRRAISHQCAAPILISALTLLQAYLGTWSWVSTVLPVPCVVAALTMFLGRHVLSHGWSRGKAAVTSTRRWADDLGFDVNLMRQDRGGET